MLLDTFIGHFRDNPPSQSLH